MTNCPLSDVKLVNYLSRYSEDNREKDNGKIRFPTRLSCWHPLDERTV